MTTAKKKESKTPRPTAGERAHSLAMEREALLQENDQLKREAEEMLADKLSGRYEASVLARDLRKRVDYVVVEELLALSERLRAQATGHAETHVKRGGDPDSVPSVVAVSVGAAEEVFMLAEHYNSRPIRSGYEVLKPAPRESPGLSRSDRGVGRG